MDTIKNNVLWAQKFGGTLADTGWNIAADGAGNTYVTGAFNDTATFGSTTLNSVGFGSDGFVGKLDSSGKFLWAQKLGGTLSDFGFGIATDGAGNSYATGFFSGSATFGSTTLTSAGNEDAFITKLDRDGKFLWTQKLGGTSSDSGYGIAADGEGNTYVAGVLNATSIPGSVGASTNFTTSDDAFITKLDNNGNVLWTKNLNGIFLSDRGIGITTDGAGNTYATGFFSGTTTFGSTTLTSAGSQDAFITKLDRDGKFLWAQKLGGTLADAGVAITSDEAGNTYATGIFRNTATFGSTTLTSAGDEDAFITKLDSNGNVLWAKKLGGTGVDEGLGIVADGSGNIYVSGTFTGTVSFGSTTLTSKGDYDAFVAQIDSNGNVLSAQNFGGASIDLAIGIAADGTGNTYATGAFSDTGSFGNTSLTSAGSLDGFIVKLGDKVEEPQISLNLAPNSVTEDGNENLSYTFTRTGNTTDSLTVNFKVDGNATYNTDYIPLGTDTFNATNGSVSFKAGANTATVTIDPTADTTVESDETVGLTLASGTGYTIGTSDVIMGKIINDDTQIISTPNNVLWAQRFGGASYDYANDITVDSSGNTYVTGSFEGTATFESTTLTSAGNEDAFVTKLDSTGKFLWAQKFGGSLYDYGDGITIDSSGNTYVTGSFEGTASFGSTTLTSASGQDVFVTKLDSTGNVLWAQKLGGAYASDITVDSLGNTYVTGSFYDTAKFGNTTLTSAGKTDGFVAKLDSNGNVLSAQKFGGTSYDDGIAIAADNSGNTYVTGSFEGTASFGSTTLTSAGNEDAFVTKLDSSSNILWTQKLGGASYDYANDITVDSSGNTYVTGNFSGTATFGSTTLTSAGNEDAFVTKLDSSGKFLWAQKFGGTMYDYGNGITVDSSGNTYVTGNFSGTATFGSTTLTSAGSEHGFITKLDSNGNILSAQKLGGYGNGIATDGAGNTYVTGEFNNTTSFGNTSLTSAGSLDGFVVKLGDQVDKLPITVTNEKGSLKRNADNIFSLNGKATPLQFTLKSSSASAVNEIGLFTVDDDKGAIDGIAPNDPNYTQAALARSRSIFSVLQKAPSGFNTNLNRTLDFDGDKSFRLLTVQNGTLDGLKNGTVPVSQMLLSSPTSLQVSDLDNSVFDLRFNDTVVSMQLGTQPKPIGTSLQDKQEGEVLDLRELTGLQKATLTVNREAVYNNFVGFFRVTDANGGIDTNSDGVADLLPGQAGYGETAVKNRVGGIDLSVANQGTANFTGQFEPGSIFAPFLIVNGTPDPFLDSNPNNNPAIYFPYLGANSDKVDHVRMLGDNVFGFEDLVSGGDKDFNDIIVSVKFG